MRSVSWCSITFGGKRPYGITWDMGIQKVFHKDYTFEARYVGTRGVHLWTQTHLITTRWFPLQLHPHLITMPSAATFAAEPRTLGQVESYIVPGGTADDPYNSLAVYGSAAKMTGYNPEADIHLSWLGCAVEPALSQWPESPRRLHLEPSGRRRHRN